MPITARDLCAFVEGLAKLESRTASVILHASQSCAAGLDRGCQDSRKTVAEGASGDHSTRIADYSRLFASARGRDRKNMTYQNQSHDKERGGS